MLMEMLSWMLAIPLLGLASGLRTMTPMAVLCWFSYLGYLPVGGTWASWTSHGTTVAIFTVCAIGELMVDKLPRTPNRTAPGPLFARLVFGGLVGCIAATALNGAGIEGVLLGVVGAALGAFGGFMVRRHIVETAGCTDGPIALTEDIFTLICAILAMHVVTS